MADGPIQAEYFAKMNNLAASLDEFFNGPAMIGRKRTTGFALLVFGMGEVKQVNYISNGDRADMLASMKHFIARAEGQPNIGGMA